MFPNVPSAFPYAPGQATAISKNWPISRAYPKPSDGLEPSTPSLPWRFWGSTGVHGRASAGTFFLLIEKSLRVADVRV
jgi:hypothetical protein